MDGILEDLIVPTLPLVRQTNGEVAKAGSRAILVDHCWPGREEAIIDAGHSEVIFVPYVNSIVDRGASMKSSQQDLLNRILASPYFAHTVNLGRILSYVCEKTVDSENRIKEYEIATEVCSVTNRLNPKLDPVVRVSMKGVRERLDKYFDNVGQREPLRLAIPKRRVH